MININECKNTAKLLADKAKERAGGQKLQKFVNVFNEIIAEYYDKYKLYSTAIDLQTLKSFNEWLPSLEGDKTLLTPILVDRMVNEKNLYSLSLYQNLYAGSELIPCVSDFKSEYYAHGGGEHALAMITGCYWIEQIYMIGSDPLLS